MRFDWFFGNFLNADENITLKHKNETVTRR